MSVPAPELISWSVPSASRAYRSDVAFVSAGSSFSAVEKTVRVPSAEMPPNDAMSEERPPDTRRTPRGGVAAEAGADETTRRPRERRTSAGRRMRLTLVPDLRLAIDP